MVVLFGHGHLVRDEAAGVKLAIDDAWSDALREARRQHRKFPRSCLLLVELDLLSSRHAFGLVVQVSGHLAPFSLSNKLGSEGVVELTGLHLPPVLVSIDFWCRHCGRVFPSSSEAMLLKGGSGRWELRCRDYKNRQNFGQSRVLEFIYSG